MKKIMIFAVAVLTLAACSKTFDHSKAATEGNAIGFGTWAETLTKARATASDNTAFKAGESFNVFGYKTIPGTPDPTVSEVFDGDVVTATASGSGFTWDYTQHRYWDPAASSYTFYAVLPSGLLKDMDTADYWEDGEFESNDIDFNAPTATSATSFEDDILVAQVTTATPTGSGPYDYSTYSGEGKSVGLTFKHIASCVDLKVKQDANLGNAVVTVTKLALLNIHNSGHFTISYSGVNPVATWAENSTVSYLGTATDEDGDSATDYYKYEILGSDSADDVIAGGKTPYTSHAAGTIDGTPAPLFTGYVFMPQELTAADQQLMISYTIKVGNEAAIEYNDIKVDLVDFFTTDTDNKSGTAIDKWATNTHYTYYITIGAGNVIMFSATVDDWTNSQNGYSYLIN